MKTVRKLMAIMLLLMICMVASADVKVDLNESYKGGKIEVKGQVASESGGSMIVTITVTPDFGYKITRDDVLVVPTYPAAKTRSGEDPGIAEPLKLNGDDPEDLTASREYTFEVEEGFGAWVKEANFREAEMKNDISGDGQSSVKWAYDSETKVMTITGTGLTADFGGENKVPWASAKDKIESVVIEKGVTSLGANLFEGCTSLKSVKIENAEQVLKLGEGAIPAGVQVDVPGNLYNEYMITDGWKDLTVGSEKAVPMKDITFSVNDYDSYVSAETILVPSVLTAYVITGVSEKGLDLKEVSVITPDVPVLVYSKDKSIATYYSAATEDTKGVSDCLLKVAPAGGQEVKLGEAYVLYNDVFYYCQAGTIPEGNVYLPNSSPQKSRSMYALGGKDGNTTGIAASPMTDIEEEPVWYSLDGRRLDTMPTRKGVYIMNGKKVVIK